MPFDPDDTVLLADVTDYVNADGSAYPQDTIKTAMGAEIAAQAKRCRIPDPPTADLTEALRRRVARNLAMRKQPLGVQALITDVAATGVHLGGLDPEVKRLEAPYRRWAVG